MSPWSRPRAAHPARAPLVLPAFSSSVLLALALATLPAHAANRPLAVSGTATNITATGATFSGTVDPNNAEAAAFFDYGTTNVPYSAKLAGTPGSVTGGAPVPITAVVQGLACGTTYHFRMHATNRLGENKGADRTFTTLACGSTAPPPSPAATPPSAGTAGVADVTGSAATIAGVVTAGTAATAVSFEWGTTTSYGASIAATPASLAPSATPVGVTAALTGLACGTAYHFRAKATSSAGTATGVDQAFNTAACTTPPAPVAPTAATGSAVPTATGATLAGSVIAGSASASATFEWGATAAYGNTAAATPASLPAAATAAPVAATLSGLACGTTYQYRVKAASSAGTGSGANASFSTAACGAPGGGATLRVSVSGFGHVASDVGGLSCGSVPLAAAGSSARCYAAVSGNVTLTATPFNASFVFAGWTGDAACAGNVCTVPASGAKWVRAKFVPASTASNVCTAVGLVGDKAAHPLNASYPALAAGQSFVDPNFRTTIRKLTGATSGGVVPAYSTISAFNADESYLLLYRVGGAHELYDGRSYAFIRTLSDLPTADVEQFYWDTTRPNFIYGASGTTLYRYDVDAPAGSRLTALRSFATQCGTKSLYGGSDPFFNSWDSRVFGLACVASGALFSYDAVSNTVGAIAATLARADGSTSPQAAPSGRRLILNQTSAVRVLDLNLVGGPQLDQASGDEHASMTMFANGNDAYATVNFDPGPSGTGEGTVVTYNLDAAPNGANRITGRVIVGPATGYPYPPSGTHIGGTAFHRSGLLAASVRGSGSGATLLDNELLLVDADPATNPAGAACRIGHHRSNSTSYWAEPHATISPSGTRIVFGSSWGNSAAGAVVNAYVVELPGYRP